MPLISTLLANANPGTPIEARTRGSRPRRQGLLSSIASTLIMDAAPSTFPGARSGTSAAGYPPCPAPPASSYQYPYQAPPTPLSGGRFLVYPPALRVQEIADQRTGNNTGYKDADPGHPCRKCWESYARPYTGAPAAPALAAAPGGQGYALPSFQPTYAPPPAANPQQYQYAPPSGAPAHQYAPPPGSPPYRPPFGQ
ncbi:hypothetical protein B0H17DRAFT_1040703 [Mycena rosella]|uniref:Uncharacterized protein n=1 Tax=Mycena rosella TaxID=1033263 RepID=A0AAD7GRF9_MYCRO|nr:hypothetical protein B0H17DRAFT_1040703 [Mycena rosella]